MKRLITLFTMVCLITSCSNESNHLKPMVGIWHISTNIHDVTTIYEQDGSYFYKTNLNNKIVTIPLVMSPDKKQFTLELGLVSVSLAYDAKSDKILSLGGEMIRFPDNKIPEPEEWAKPFIGSWKDPENGNVFTISYTDGYFVYNTEGKKDRIVTVGYKQKTMSFDKYLVLHDSNSGQLIPPSNSPYKYTLTRNTP